MFFMCLHAPVESQYFAEVHVVGIPTRHAVMISAQRPRPEPGSVSEARQALLRFTAPITMGGDEPIAPPPLEEVVNALKVLAYHPAGGGATESHRAHLYSAALAFLQILRDDGRTLRCAKFANLRDEIKSTRF